MMKQQGLGCMWAWRGWMMGCMWAWMDEWERKGIRVGWPRHRCHTTLTFPKLCFLRPAVCPPATAPKKQIMTRHTTQTGVSPNSLSNSSAVQLQGLYCGSLGPVVLCVGGISG